MSEEETVTATENADATPAEETTESVETEEVEAELTEESDADSEDAEVEEKVDPRDRKLAELAYKERETRRRNAQLERLLEQQANKPAAEAPKAPKIEDFTTIDEYVDAKLEYHDKLRQQGTEPANAKAPESSIDEVEFRMNLDDLYGNGIAKHADFMDVVSGDHVPITAEMANTIFAIDDPDLQVDTAYYLGTNPKEAARIAKQPLVRQIAEVTRLADKLLAKRTSKEKPKSKAPEPIKPVGGTKTVTNELRDEMSFEEFMKVRNKQLGRG